MRLQLNIMDRKCFERKETTAYLKDHIKEIKEFVNTYSNNERWYNLEKFNPSTLMKAFIIEKFIKRFWGDIKVQRNKLLN